MMDEAVRRASNLIRLLSYNPLSSMFEGRRNPSRVLRQKTPSLRGWMNDSLSFRRNFLSCSIRNYYIVSPVQGSEETLASGVDVEFQVVVDKLLSTCNTSDEQKGQLRQLLLSHRKMFSLPHEPLGTTDWVRHFINIEGADPVKVRRFMLPHHHREIMKKITDQLLSEGTIQPSKGPWSFRCFWLEKNVRKKEKSPTIERRRMYTRIVWMSVLL